jgi:SAM-dependent methyltransferase
LPIACAAPRAFDTSRQMLAIARASLGDLKAKAAVRFGDAYAPPIDAGAADLVTIHQVLHFLSDPGRAIAEAARLLRSGGRLVIVDFAPHALEFLREEHAHRRLGFSDAEIAEWCEGAGLSRPKTTTLRAEEARRTDREDLGWGKAMSVSSTFRI